MRQPASSPPALPTPESRPDSGLGLTGYLEYPRIAAERFAVSLERLARVREGFRGELGAIGAELDAQTGIAARAVADSRRAGPLLESMGAEARAIAAALAGARSLVREGRGSLKTSVSEVQGLIALLEERNASLGAIIELGREVSEGVARIAEIAVENKLIAINAAVTSSKAGDRVRGFKVIASELSKLSGSMAGRVERVVGQAARVSERVDGIMRSMGEGIEAARRALGTIDEAYALLDGVEESLGRTESIGREAEAENEALAKLDRAFAQALESIQGGIAATRDKAADIAAITARQDRSLEELRSLAAALREACSGLESAPGSSAPPAEGRILRLAESPIDNHDPALARMIRELHLVSFTSIRLLRYSSDLKIVPYLAESWSLGEDGRTWTFRLAEVRFHDGSPVRARDVKFSLERLLNPALGSPYAGLYEVIEGAKEFATGSAREVSGIRILGDRALSITLRDSFNYFLSLLALGYATIIKEDPSLFSRPIRKGELLSAGPFRLVPDADEGRDRLVANRGFVYGRPYVDGLEIRRSREGLEEILASGGLDLAYNMTAASDKRLKAAGFQGSLSYYESRYCYGLAVNYRRPSALARHPELRLALALAFDKEALVSEDLEGAAAKADTLVSPRILDTGARAGLSRNLDEARRLVAALRGKVDLSAPFKVAIRDYPAIPNLDRLGARIRATFESLGLRAETELRPLSDSLASFAPAYDLVFVGFLPEIDLYSALEPFINPEGGDNYYGFSDPELSRMLEATIAIKDPAERRERFVAILERLIRDVFMVPLFFLKVLAAGSRELRSVVVSAEESFLPDWAFFAPRRGEVALDQGARRRVEEALARVEGTAASLGAEARGFQAAGRELGRAIGLQRTGIGEAGTLFADFDAASGRVERSRGAMLARIKETVAEAAASGRAARLVEGGLSELRRAVESTREAVAQVWKEITEAKAEVADLAAQDAFIGSIAVNAAIIAAKAQAGDGDLKKVSASIAGQASRNAEQTGKVLELLGRMEEGARGHVLALEGLARGLADSERGAGSGGQVLEGVGPRLQAADGAASAIGEAACELNGSVSAARKAVEEMSRQAARLADHVDGLRFGLDLEEASVEVLADYAEACRDMLKAIG